MVTYQNDASFWLQWTSKRVYVSCQGKNLLWTPVHDCIQDWIQAWTREWYPALMTSTVWPVWLPGDYHYVKRWDGGTITRAWSEAQERKWKPDWYHLKALITGFLLSLHLGADILTIFHIFNRLIVFRPRAPKYRLCLAHPSLYFNLTTLWFNTKPMLVSGNSEQVRESMWVGRLRIYVYPLRMTWYTTAYCTGPEVGSSLDDEYSVTHVAVKAAWYSPCLRWSRSRVSGRIFGRKTVRVVG